MNVHVRDGQVVRTSARDMPNTEYNRICPRGLTHVGRMYSSERVLYPMKRVGERGSNDFERISWDEALDTIAEKWKSYREQFGPKSIMFFYGSGNYALYSGSCNAAGAVVRFENILGCTDAGLDVDVGTGYGASRAHGGADLGNELTDRKNAKTQILWGNNPAISLPHTLHFMMEAKENGTRLIVIDPVYNPNTAKADWWIPVKPGTDGALALGVLNVLIGNGWVDEDTLRSKTNCGLLIKEDGMYLRMSDLGVEPTEGDVDPLTGKPKVISPPAVWDEAASKAVAFSEAQKPALKNVAPIEGIVVQTVYENAMSYISAWTPEAASAVCGVSVEDIQELARVYHEDGPVTTEIMQGLNHYRNAHYTGWPVYLVGLLTGNAGKPGAAIGQSEEYLPQMLFSNIKGACYPVNSAGEAAPGISGHLDTTVFEEVFTTGKFKGEDYVVKSAYIHCSNPLVTMCSNDYTSRWIDALEFVVVADMCMTETCKYADIVLPAAHWFEQQDIGFLFSSHPYLLWQEKCVEPQGESKPDFQIFWRYSGSPWFGRVLVHGRRVCRDHSGFRVLKSLTARLRTSRRRALFASIRKATSWAPPIRCLRKLGAFSCTRRLPFPTTLLRPISTSRKSAVCIGRLPSTLARTASIGRRIRLACCPSTCALIPIRNGGNAATCASSSASRWCVSTPMTRLSWALQRAIPYAYPTITGMWS